MRESEAEAERIYENAIKAGQDPSSIGANAVDIVNAQKQTEDIPNVPESSSTKDILA